MAAVPGDDMRLILAYGDLDKRVHLVRRFNRFYTHQIGLVRKVDSLSAVCTILIYTPQGILCGVVGKEYEHD
jgi:hypothetical protein